MVFHEIVNIFGSSHEDEVCQIGALRIADKSEKLSLVKSLKNTRGGFICYYINKVTAYNCLQSAE